MQTGARLDLGRRLAQIQQNRLIRQNLILFAGGLVAGIGGFVYHAIAHSIGMSVRLAKCVMVYIMPSGMMPLPVGVSVAIRKRSNWSALRIMSPNSKVVRKFPAVHTCNAIWDS